MQDLESATISETEVDALSAEPEANETPARHINSVDATAHQPMVARVLARKSELEALQEVLPAHDRDTRNDIDLALATINDLLTGDLADVPAVVVADMNRWLERSKHVGERHAAPPESNGAAE